jgi:hypothetical protein
LCVLVFTRFTGTFQKDKPLIHIIFDEITTLLLTLLGRICKPELLGNDKNINETVLNQENLLPLNQISVGTNVDVALEGLQERTRLEFYKLVQKHYVAACNHIFKKAPIYGSLKYFRYLKPDERKSKSSSDIIKSANLFPFDQNNNFMVDRQVDERKLIQYEKYPIYNAEFRIDTFWNDL